MLKKGEDKRKPSDYLLSVISTNVKHHRKEKGLSQEKLGELCNFHPTFISLIERSQRNITISTLEILANALEIEIHKILQAPSNQASI
ncbi:MAG: helix-turn-helix domain-containing protein [Colwellia sp.]